MTPNLLQNPSQESPITPQFGDLNEWNRYLIPSREVTED